MTKRAKTKYSFDNISEIFAYAKDTEAHQENMIKTVRIHILSGVTFTPLDHCMRYFTSKSNVELEFSIGLYDQVRDEAIFKSLDLNSSDEIIYFHVSSMSMFSKSNNASKPKREEKFPLYKEYLALIEALSRKYSQNKIVVNTLEAPPFRTRGTFSSRNGELYNINKFNLSLIELCNKNKNLLLQDLNYIASSVGLENWFDFNAWAAFKQPFSHKALPRIGSSLASIVLSHIGLSKKLIVTDLDNTLWGGIVGDDGIDAIQIGNTSAKGEIYSFVQSYLKELKNYGIMLSINSKNEYNIIQEAFKSKQSTLDLQDFSVIKTNWDLKSKNLKETLKELNLLAQSAVFLDDNPAELYEVEQNEPDCVSFSYTKSPIEMLFQLEKSGFFEAQEITSEDEARSEYYANNAKRNKLQKIVVDKDRYLMSLKMSSTIKWKDPSPSKRLSDLSKKTNQFNFTQKSLSEEKVETYCKDNSKWISYANLSDKFGDNGIVSFCFGRVKNKILYLDNWVMSCRVFNRDLETVVINALIKKALEHDCTYIEAAITTNDKNIYCQNVFKKYGFEEKSYSLKGKSYLLKVDEKKLFRSKFIEVKYG